MSKSEYIVSNRYLRKWFSRLSSEDISFFSDVALWKYDLRIEFVKNKYRDICFRMSSWMNLIELRWLYKAFQVLSKLSN